MIALGVIDVQEKLFPHIHRHEELLKQLQKATKGFECLNIPIVVFEQVPEKMGKTLKELQLPHAHPKALFSACNSELLNYAQIVLVGIEAHVCVLQTARDLIEKGKKVILLSDAVGSRSNIDYLSALNEMQQFGVRLTTVETLLFELLKSSEHAAFRKIRDIVK